MDLQAQPRTVFGKQVARLRLKGITPASIYGKAVESIAVQVSSSDLTRLLNGARRNDVITLELPPNKYAVVVRLIQRNPITQEILHMDFLRVSSTESMHAEVGVNLVGVAPIIASGMATLLRTRERLEVSGIAAALPSAIEVDISGWEDVEQVLKAGDVPLPAGVTLVTDPETTIAMLTPAHAEAPAETPAVTEEKTAV